MIKLLLLLLLTSAYAHDMPTNAEEARTYAFYKSWKRPPDRMMSCCGGEDCHAVDVKQENGHWAFFDKLQGLWRRIPDDRLEHNFADARESVDGRNHVCYNTMYVLCAVLGSGQ